jgi:hypothetical protein
MYKPEGVWGWLARLCRQHAHAAASMLYALEDYEQACWLVAAHTPHIPQPADQLTPTPATGRGPAQDKYAAWASKLQLLSTPSLRWDPELLAGIQLPVHALGTGRRVRFDELTVAQLHTGYCNQLPTTVPGQRPFGELWGLVARAHVTQRYRTASKAASARISFRRDSWPNLINLRLPSNVHKEARLQWQDDSTMNGALISLTPQEARLSEQFALAGTEHRAAEIGPIKFRVGDWFLCKPVEGDRRLWFGMIRRIIRHEGPDGRTYVLFDATWHNAGTSSNMQLRAPVVPSASTALPHGPMWMTSQVVPVHCWAEPVPHRRNNSHLMMIARTWEVVRHVPGLGQVI